MQTLSFLSAASKCEVHDLETKSSFNMFNSKLLFYVREERPHARSLNMVVLLSSPLVT